MATHTLISDQDFATLFLPYHLGDFTCAKPIASGIENTNYFVTLHKQAKRTEYVFTLFEEIPAAQLLPYLELLNLLQKHNINVAPPLSLKNGDLFGTYHQKPFILCPRLPGEHLIAPNLHQVLMVTKQLAQVHAIDYDVCALPEGIRSHDWLQNLLACSQSRLAPADFDRLNFIFEAFIDVSEHLPKGIIHGDLFRDNVIFHKDNLSGLIDFFNASEGLLIFDLAIFINDWAVDENRKLDRDRVSAILTEYQSIRALTEAERTALPLMLKVAAMRFWLSRLQTPSTKKPEEFEQLFRFLGRCEWLDNF